MSMPPHLTPQLRAAYEQTRYIVFVPGAETLSLTIGSDAPTVAMLFGRPVLRLAVVTAANPFSAQLSDEENARRMEELRESILAHAFDFVLARGEDPHGVWKPEESFAVLDPDDTALDAWMEEFDQYAVVVAENGGTVRLRFHPRCVEGLGGREAI